MTGIIALPLPDEMLMTFVGYNVYLGKMSYSLSIASSFLGAITGITVSYLLGVKMGLPFLKKFGPKVHITQAKIECTQRLFDKYGNMIILIGYFIPGVRHITAYLAGISKIGFRRFGLFAYSGAFIWSFTFITLGKELGEQWLLMKGILHQFGFYIAITFLVFIAVLMIGMKLRKKRIKKGNV